jgi:hypothetical protein
MGTQSSPTDRSNCPTVRQTATPSLSVPSDISLETSGHSGHSGLNTDCHVITVSSDKHFELVYKGQVVLVGNADCRWRVGGLNTDCHVITFSSDKHFGLVSKSQVVLVGNADCRWRVGGLECVYRYTTSFRRLSAV